MARTGLQKGIKKADPKRYPLLFFYIGRNGWIRTTDLCDPNAAFYQAELRSVPSKGISTQKKIRILIKLKKKKKKHTTPNQRTIQKILRIKIKMI